MIQESGACSHSRAAAGSRERAIEWAQSGAVWRLIEDGRICVRPSDIVKLLDERDRYRSALEEIAGNESSVNAILADGIAIGALAFENAKS